MKHIATTVSAAIFLLVGATSSAMAALPTSYSLSGGITWNAKAINDSGQIAGETLVDTSQGMVTRGFIQTGSSVQILGVLRPTTSSFTNWYTGATDINNAGQAVGQSQADDISVYRAYISNGSTVKDIGGAAGNYSAATGINNAGQVVGYVNVLTNGTHAPERAFIYSGGNMTILGTLGGNASWGQAINNQGVIVGNSQIANGDMHAFVSNGTTMTDLGTLGGNYSTALSINDAGWITGTSSDVNGLYSAFISNGTSMTSLGGLMAGGRSTGKHINSQGWVVGSAAIDAQGDTHGFLFDGTSMIDLTTLLNISGQGWYVSDAFDITDTGLILAQATRYDGTLSEQVLLTASNLPTTPVPEPATMALMALGCVGLGAAVRRERNKTH